MHYYADYEALEFNTEKSVAKGIFPYYLNIEKADSALCPIFLSCCNHKGKLIQSQSCLDSKISFISLLNKLININKNNKNLFIWFHNVQYDFRIIVHELFYNGFINIVDSKNITYYGDYKSLDDSEKAFSIIGKSLSKYIGANIYYRGYRFNIRDTMSILNSSQDKILKEFKFDKKIYIDWDKITINNIDEYINLIRERCEYDVQSLSKAIEQFKLEFRNKFFASGNTASSISLDALKYHLFLNKRLKTNEEINKEELFREYYPQLEYDAKELSQACYHGGICTLSKSNAGKFIDNIQMLDINSSYTYAMTQPLPYGVGQPLKDFTSKGFSEYIVYIKFTNRGIPFQRCHSENTARRILGLEPTDFIYTRSEFPEKFEGYLCINSIDLSTLKQYSNISSLDFIKGLSYKTNSLLKDFLIPIYNQRKNSKDVAKLAIKLILNSLYGKFAQDLSGKIFLYKSLEEYIKLDAIDNNTFYKPLAGAVTAYARKNWVNMAYMLGDDFIYGDTDSVYFTNVNKNISKAKHARLIHDSELGKWKTDKSYGKYIFKGKFLSKKNYLLYHHEGKKVVCVGLPSRYHSNINKYNFNLNSEVFNIQKMVNIYGGKAMRRTVFKIRERIF